MTISSVHPSLLPYLEQRLSRLLVLHVQANCTTWILLSLSPSLLGTLGLQTCTIVPSSYTGFQGSKLGLHVWVANTLFTESSSQSSAYSLKESRGAMHHRCMVVCLYELFVDLCYFIKYKTGCGRTCL